jgi:hypothetical protein
MIRNIIISTIREFLNEQQSLKETWFHGTPDGREIEQLGGFTQKTITVPYINDIIGFNELQLKINIARKNEDNLLLTQLLNDVSNFKDNFRYKKPLFLTDKYSVAKTYANPKRAFDYQNALDKVLEVDVECEKIVKIMANGEKFRSIPIDMVKSGFINYGVPEEEIDNLISRFNFYVKENYGIQTDVIAAIGNWLGVDCIDVVGVIDTYEGTKNKSTVRIVLDTDKVKIKKNN